MAYVKRIIGNDEHIIGIARLHWIYLAQGLFAFAVCMSIGFVFNAVLFKALTLVSDYAPNASETLAVGVNTWVMPLAIITGGLYFMFYLLKVLYSEIALTEKRIIYKRGFIFVKIQEIDIEEISGENMDMGYFGSILGYAYIMLDCRFVGDVTLPAIAKANVFIKALHAARTHTSPVIPDQNAGVAPIAATTEAVHSSTEKPEHEMIKPPEPKPVEEINEHGELVIAADPSKKDIEKQIEVAAVQHVQEKEILQLEIAKLELEVKLKEIEADNSEEDQNHASQQAVASAPQNNPPTQVASVAPPAVSAVVDSASMAKMPQITDSIAEELIAKGLIPHPDDIKPIPEFVEEPLSPREPPDEERLEPTKTDALINSFGGVAVVLEPDTGPKPAPAI